MAEEKGIGTENAGQLQVVVLSVRPLLAFCPLAMFFSFFFAALLFLVFFCVVQFICRAR